MELIAEKRTELGKKSKKLAREKKLPGVIFGKGFESIPITVDYLKFERLFSEAGETSLVDLNLTSEPIQNTTKSDTMDTGSSSRNFDSNKVLISEVAVHPITGRFVHANFKKVNLKEKITANVPVKIVGESPVVKDGEGLLLTLIDEVTVEALPSDLPHDIKVDISGLTEVDQAITIGDLQVDRSKVEIKGHDNNELVVKIDYAEMKEEEVATPSSEAELVAKVAVTEQLTEEEKAKKAAEEKTKREKEEK